MVVEDTIIDYSQPIVLATSPSSTAGTAAYQTQDGGQASSKDVAMGLLNAARDAFIHGDLSTAMTQCNKAIAKSPNDPMLHEFRGLVIFAQGDYKQAAAVVYAVLSVGPGWDWTTMSGFYPQIDVYTKQLRALEEYARANPNMPEAKFLLGYHYMTCGHNDAAAEQFKTAAQLNPADRVSAQLVTSLTKTEASESAAPSTADAPALPVDAGALSGDWKASRPDGATIALSLADGKYTWKYIENDKTQEFSGTYSVADNLLILKQNNSPTMVGEVTLLPDNRFTFKLPGGSPDDPGLTFGK